MVSWRQFHLSTAAACCVLGGTLVTPAYAQCSGDENADGRVVIQELVTAVNNALHGCALPFDVQQTFADSAEVQTCAARLIAAGFTPGSVESVGPVNSFCDTSRCELSILAIQHFELDAQGRSLGALVTYRVSGGPDHVEVLRTPPFDACDE